MAGDPKVLKKTYCAPSFHILDVSAARKELGAKTKSKSKDAARMLSLMEGKPGVHENAAQIQRRSAGSHT